MKNDSIWRTVPDNNKARIAIYDVLIRDNQLIEENMKTEVSNQIDTFTKDVKSEASSSGVTYKTQLSKKLEEKGVENLTELAEIYTLEKQKEKYESTWYSDRINWEDGKDDLTKKFIDTANPYHIRHILVKTDGAGSSLYQGTITEEESLKLSSVAERLASGKETFGQIAQQASEDEGSASIYGSYLVHRDTSFINEFKLGCYAYDAFIDTHTNNSAVSKAERQTRLGIPEKVEYTSVQTGKKKTFNVQDEVKTIAEVPYTVIEQLRDYSDKTKTESNLTYVPNSNDAIWDGTNPKNVDKLGGQTINENYYPRNILFNNYFNDHGLFVITEEGFNGASDRFKSFPAISDKKILCDEKGNPVLITRGGSGDSYQGVHFMVIEQSPFWFDESKLDNATPLTDKSKDEDGNITVTTEDYLRYYYSTNIPSTSSEDVSNDQRYVTFIKTNRSEYQKRADAITSAVKEFDSNIKYEIFEDLLNSSKEKKGVTINEEILKAIQDMIAQQRASAEYTLKQSQLSSWKSYVELLELQTDQKEAKQLDLQFIKMYDAAYQATAIDLA